MMAAMQLQDSPDYLGDNPEAPIPIQRSDGSIEEMDPIALAAEGMQFAYRDMVNNGPIRPKHSANTLERGLDTNKMTKKQLEEQKMNEEAGYPSSLPEAEKVKELESKVANIETGIQSILSHLSGQSSQVQTQQSVPSGGSPVRPAEPPTPIAVPSVIVGQPSLLLTDSDELKQQENKQPKLRKVTLKDGRTISVPQTSSRATSLGAVSEEDELSDWDDDIIQAVPEPELPKADPKMERTQKLFEDVVGFMQNNDVHKFWRRHVANSFHRHLGYTGWSKELQNEFDGRFRDFLNDPQFVTSVCRKIAGMEMGYAISEKHAASLVVAAAGFTAFTLCGL
jgi:hypothetical protein